MTSFIIRRLIQALFVIIIVSILVFFIMRLLPGDPILLYLTLQDTRLLTQQDIDNARHEYGLDKPMMVQYIDWLDNIFHGDFGMSLFAREKVGKLLAQRLPVTLHLGLVAFAISAVLGIVAGILSSIRRGTWIDALVTVLANTGICIPIFWLGIVLIFVFGLQFHWLPTNGYTSPVNDFWLSTKQLIMPVFCLMIFGLSAGARQTRSAVLEVIQQDYIRTAYAKGLRERIVVLKHVLKNSLIPVITLMGIGFSNIVGGSVLIETVFNIPGMGRLAVTALLNQDYSIVQAVVLLTATMVVIVNLFVDITYGWLDPRIRYG